MMSEYGTTSEDYNCVVAPSSRFDTAIEWVLTVLLAFMPVVFGVVHAWSEEIVVILSGVIVFCFLLKLICCRCNGLVWTSAYVPIGAFLLVVILQIVPLPISLVQVFSPNTATMKTELLGDLPGTQNILKYMTLSFYSNASKHDLRLVISIAAVFVVVFNVFRRPEQIRKLLMTIALIGGAIAAIALAHNLFGNGKIYWLISSRNSRGYSGPFVNHSNYGQFMNLSIGAAFAWICVKLHEDFKGKTIMPVMAFDYFTSSLSKTVWLFVGIIGLEVATVFLSLSRGGMVSMLIAFGFTALLLSRRQFFKGHGWVMIVMTIAAFICILYVGFDAVYERLATLRNFQEAEGGRLQILKDIKVIWSKFLMLGTGLGTHSVVYPMFDRSNITTLAAHAENEYAQMVEETGLVGFGLLTAFGIIIWLNYARSIRNAETAVCSAAYGLGFGILAILIHSLSDFGQHLPANAFLSAIFCALLLVLAQEGSGRAYRVPIIGNHYKFKMLYAMVFLGFSIVWVWAIVDANKSSVAEAYWKKAAEVEKNLIERNWQGTKDEYADLISYATAASNSEPEDVKYRYWLNLYRWRSISQTADPVTREVVISDNLMPAIQDIISQFHCSYILCPTYGPAYCMAGQIEKFILHNDNGAAEIRKGFRLAPCDPIACFVCGYLDAMEGKDKDCFEKFKRAVELDYALFENVISIYINHLSRPYLALCAAGDNIDRLGYVAGIFEEMQYKDLFDQATEKRKSLLEKEISKRDASASVIVSLARIYAKQRNNTAAIEYYQRALALDYGQVGWRLELARLLAEIGRVPEAVQETRRCLRLRPGLKDAEKLLGNLSIRAVAFDKEIKSPQ